MNTDALQTFIGKKHDYFFRKWDMAAQTRNKAVSWNWAAFLIGPVWLAYRKMYAYALMVFGLIVLESVVEYALDWSSLAGNATGAVVGVVLGMQGNHLYKLHAQKKVKEITATHRIDQVDDVLRRRGGTSVLAIFGYIGLLILFAVTFTVIDEQPLAVTAAGYPECTSPMAAQQYKDLLNDSGYAKSTGVQVDDVVEQTKISESSDGKTLVCQAKVLMDDGRDMRYELTFTPAAEAGHIYVRGKVVRP